MLGGCPLRLKTHNNGTATKGTLRKPRKGLGCNVSAS